MTHEEVLEFDRLTQQIDQRLKGIGADKGIKRKIWDFYSSFDTLQTPEALIEMRVEWLKGLTSEELLREFDKIKDCDVPTLVEKAKINV